MKFKKMARLAHIVFLAANWKWWNFEGAPTIPTTDRIERTLHHLYETVDDPETDTAETGRFVVIKERDEENSPVEIKVCLVLGSEIL